MNEKISEKHIREEKIERLKEKINIEIDSILNNVKSGMKIILSESYDGFEEDWNFYITRAFCLARLKEYISSDSAFQTIEAEYPDHDIVIYQVSDECLNIWLQEDYNFVLSFLSEVEFEKIYDVYEILNDRYLGYEFINAFEMVIYKEKAD